MNCAYLVSTLSVFWMKLKSLSVFRIYLESLSVFRIYLESLSVFRIIWVYSVSVFKILLKTLLAYLEFSLKPLLAYFCIIACLSVNRMYPFLWPKHLNLRKILQIYSISKVWQFIEWSLLSIFIHFLRSNLHSNIVWLSFFI